jgi:hypothetical protein
LWLLLHFVHYRLIILTGTGTAIFAWHDSKKSRSRIIAYLCSSSLAQAVGEGTTGAHLKAVGDPVQGHGGFVAQATGESTHACPSEERTEVARFQ